MSRYKPGSGIGKMWTAYESGGATAATALGLSLSLAAATVKTRVDGWEREKRNGGPAPKLKKPAKVPKRRIVATDKQRVKATYKPYRLGYIMVEGPEVSGVRWDGSDSDIYINNEFLKPVKGAGK